METEIKEKPVTAKKTKPTPPTETLKWGKREYGNIAKLFEAEPFTVQEQLVTISSQLQIIKLNLSEEPLVISYLLRKAYPGMKDEDILKLVDNGGELASGLLDIRNITAGMSDTLWNMFWLGRFLSNSAPVTQWEKLTSYAPYVYNVLVKPTIR